MATIQFDDTIVGTLDELEPRLRSFGFVAVRTMAGAQDLATFDPYGMRRLGSVNIQSAKWAHHIWRGCLAHCDGTTYLADACHAEIKAPFVGGLFELLTAAQVATPAGDRS